MEVAVLDPLPLFGHGVLAALGRGTALDSGAEVRTWLESHPEGILLLTLDDDDAWALLRHLRGYPDIRTVAILPTFTVTTAASALRCGAVHVVPRHVDAAQVRHVVQQVAVGVVELPLAVVRVSVRGVRTDLRGPALADEELDWLRALSQGRTVASMAERSALSERVLYRRLKQLYRKLGVPNRTEAIMYARDQGWL